MIPFFLDLAYTSIDCITRLFKYHTSRFRLTALWKCNILDASRSKFSSHYSNMSASLGSSKVKITKNTNPSKKIPNENLTFGKYFTDHILTIQCTKDEGWGTPEIRPYGNFSLDPSACVLHYASELFEGLKAYRTSDNKITMFRADKNMERTNKSASRICLPNFDSEELIKLIGKMIE